MNKTSRSLALFLVYTAFVFWTGYSFKQHLSNNQSIHAFSHFGWAKIPPRADEGELLLKGYQVKFGKEIDYLGMPCWQGTPQGGALAVVIEPSTRYVCVRDVPVWEYEGGNQIILVDRK